MTQTTRPELHETALSAVDQMRDTLSAAARTIFEFGETAWREYRSCEWYVNFLREQGFTVEEGSAGMPTAFCAEWRNGDGPMIGLYAEYDGIPGNCQAAATEEKPREGLSRTAGGHTDPHSGLGVGALGGALALKRAMETHNIPGGIRFTGEPAEKVRGSKPIHAAKGYYDGLAAILSFHPYYMDPMCNTVRWDTHCGAAYSMIYRFICDGAENWASDTATPIPQSHSDVRAPGANDALNLMYMSSKSLRESMLPHDGGWSLSEAILTAGQATADNLPASLADLQYMMRVPTLAMAERLTACLDRNAEAAAAMTGCRWERHWVCKSRPGLANHRLAQSVWDALQTVGAPKWGDAAKEKARAIQKNLGLEPMEAPFLPAIEELIDPIEAERQLRRTLLPEQKNSTSDDYTELTWHAPTARLYIGRPALKAPAGYAYPNWVLNALGGMPETIDPMIMTAAKVLAVTALDILTNDTLRSEMWAEFKTRTGGGVDGDQWIAPLCDYEPPIDFRWPEYITTPRGFDWWIPSNGY
ncbi:MAG: amidohydrolase [Thalassovita sp.]